MGIEKTGSKNEELSVTGFQNATLSAANKRRLTQAFAERGESNHSGRAETVWVIQEYCREAGIPYRVEVARFEGRPVGARVIRTDREMAAARAPAGWSVEIADQWAPTVTPD